MRYTQSMDLKQSIKDLAEEYNVNTKVVSLNDLIIGFKIELEHGYVSPLTNVTNDDIHKTFQIALAHLQEYPDYYKRLQKMEKQAEKYWSTRNKPDIYN